MKKLSMMSGVAFVLALIAASLGMVGCEVDSSSDNFLRNVSINFSGFYRNTLTNDAPIVSRNTGSRIFTLDLRQTGDQLDAVDNNGLIWRGKIGEVFDTIASFTLEGTTTAGNRGTFTGSLTAEGITTGSNAVSANAKGTMTGTYAEPDLFSAFYAQATIPGAIPTGGGGGGGGGSLNVSGASTLSVGSTSSYTVTGGTAPYAWQASAGSFNPANPTGTTAIFRAPSNTTTVTITVTDSEGKSDSITVNITA
jgi:hypothetical protein